MVLFGTIETWPYPAWMGGTVAVSISRMESQAHGSALPVAAIPC